MNFRVRAMEKVTDPLRISTDLPLGPDDLYFVNLPNQDEMNEDWSHPALVGYYTLPAGAPGDDSFTCPWYPNEERRGIRWK